LPGRRRPDSKFRYPLYRRPEDLLELELGEFVPRLAGEKLVYRIAGGRARPYFSRAEIDRGAVLAGRGLEFLYLADPVERFFLQIQGSGVIQLEGSALQRVGYAASNGLSYTSVGKLLIEDGVLPRDQVSMQRIQEAFGRQPDRIGAYLERNQRYIFFREVDRGPIGSLGEVLTAGRSVAADPQVLPAAGLVYFRVPRPELRPDGTIGAGAPFERFAVIQDRGSAILGPRRIDLYCGTGASAGALAGRMRHRGELYVFLLRS
jgi:membrane-bound lytic murein transglycosylase A